MKIYCFHVPIVFFRTSGSTSSNKRKRFTISDLDSEEPVWLRNKSLTPGGPGGAPNSAGSQKEKLSFAMPNSTRG